MGEESANGASHETPEVRTYDEINADLTALIEAPEDKKAEISGRIKYDLDTMNFTLTKLIKGENTILSFPSGADMVGAVRSIAKKPNDRLLDMTRYQLRRLCESYLAQTTLASWMSKAKLLRSEAASPEDAIARLRDTLASHLSNPHPDLRSKTLEILANYRKGLGEDISPDQTIDPSDGFYVLGNTMELFGKATESQGVIQTKLLAINAIIVNSARNLVSLFDNIYEKAKPADFNAVTSCRDRLEEILTKREHSPAELDAMAAAGNEMLGYLAIILSTAAKGTTFADNLSYSPVANGKEDKPDAEKKYGKRLAPSRVFSERSLLGLKEYARTLVKLGPKENETEQQAEDRKKKIEEIMDSHINGILDEAYAAMEQVKSQVNGIDLHYSKKEELYALASGISEGGKDALDEFEKKSARLYEVGGAYAKLVFWKRSVDSLKQEIEIESQVGEWGQLLLAYVKYSDANSRKKAHQALIAYRRSLTGQADEELPDEQILEQVYSELTNTERPDLILGYAATIFELTLYDYTTIANDACRKWRDVAKFAGNMLTHYEAVSSLASAMGIDTEPLFEPLKDADKESSDKLKKTYSGGIGSVLDTPDKVVGDVSTQLRDTENQFRVLYLKVLEKLAV